MRYIFQLIFLSILLSGTPIHSNNLNSPLVYKKVLGPYQTGDTTIKDYSLSLNVTWMLTDTGNVKYLDFKSGLIHCLAYNRCPGDIRIGYNYNDLWSISYCVTKNWDSLGQFTPAYYDSQVGYLGKVEAIYNVPAFSERSLGVFNVSNIRLFVQRDTVSTGSFTTLDFRIDISAPPGETITIAAGDSIVLKLAFSDITATDQTGREWLLDFNKTGIWNFPNRIPQAGSVRNALLFVNVNCKRHITGTNVLVDKNAHLPVLRGCLLNLSGRRVK